MRGLISKCFILALLAGANVAQARSVQTVMAAEVAASAIITKSLAQKAPSKTVFDLNSAQAEVVKLSLPVANQPEQPVTNAYYAKDGARFGDGEVSYIDAALTYQRSKRGPKFELGALGGGMESAPFMAHVGLDWHF